ncbi:pentapeptide repeat-containing protein [Natrinema halophilum]|uniref:Pentapeptide repeat-containing protein n=1 Tax=Natrinema halophilum TaxID=1699371 RepID=A0A7D5KC29_9EURY|nr:pentapeptide repeat-containing protein [Natrinema halophilum]QLG48261.1 pentapeptide repeat-containing protein [Natrinema halophilum]
MCCQYEFDPSAWKNANDGRCFVYDSDLEDGVWSCPHDAVDGFDHCVFHLDSDARPEGCSVERALLSLLRSTRDQPSDPGTVETTIIGARLDNLSLPNALVSGSHQFPIDLRHATVDGSVVLRGARVVQPLRLCGVTIGGDIDLDGATVAHRLDLSGATIEGDFTLRETVFRETVSVYDVTIGGHVEAKDAAFEKTATFDEATVHDRSSFWGATFSGPARFSGLTVDDTIQFNYATFEDDAAFHGFECEQMLAIEASFEHGGTFIDTTVDGSGDFAGASVPDHLTFERASIGDTLSLDGGTIESIDFDGATIDGRLSAERITVTDRLSLEESQCPSGVDVRGGDIETLSVSLTLAERDAVRVDCRDTSIRSGTLRQPSDGFVLYDVADGTLGDVRFEAPSASNALTGTRFSQTTFEDFDFDHHLDALAAANWDLHATVAPELYRSVGGDESVDERSDPGVLESTYLKAKNGAQKTGSDNVAAEFFLRQLRHRRSGHARSFRENSGFARLKPATRWLRNAGLDLLAGYGERPLRVVGASLGVILGFALLYAVLLPELPPYGSTAGYLVLSFEGFITLVLGGAAAIPNPRIRLLAELEGFIGAFLIALFVFTLTRSIHR